MKTEIKAVEMVRRIRDAQAEQLADKKPEEIIAFFRQAGSAALEEVRRTQLGIRGKVTS